MEHALNEKMREMVGKGELSEASYKTLVDELGRTKEEEGAPLFEVTYTAHMVTPHVDEHTDNLYQTAFNLNGDTYPTTSKIVRGVTKRRQQTMTRQFVDFNEIIIGDDNQPIIGNKPGDTFVHRLREAEGNSRLVIYTIIKVSKFKKRKSSVLSEE